MSTSATISVCGCECRYQRLFLILPSCECGLLEDVKILLAAHLLQDAGSHGHADLALISLASRLRDDR